MPNWPEDPRRRNVYGDVYGQSLPMPGQSQLQGIPSLADLATLVSYQPPQQSGLPSPTFQQQQPSLGQLQPPLMPQSQQAASATDQPPKKPFFSLPDVANALYEGATQQFIPGLKGAAAQLYAGGERPDLQPEWVQRYQAEARAAQDQSQKRVQEQQAAGLSSSAGESIREAIPSLGFSLGSMAAALPAGIAGTVATGPIGGAVAAGAAAGAAGYRMAESQFLGDAFAKLEEESRKTRGRGLDEQEKVAAYRELKPIAEHTGLWEAGPEAIGNAAMFGLGRVALGFMPKEAMQNLAKTALGRVGIRAGAAAGAAGTEVATETATQVAQGNDQAKADAAIKAFVEGKPMGPAIAGAERPYDGLAGLQKAYNDVVGATLATVVMMGGLAKGAHLAYKPIANRIEAGRRGQEADTAVNQTDPIRTNLEFAREADIAEALARFDEIENTGRLPKSAARRIDAARQQLLGELSLRVSPESISAPMNSQRGMAGYLGFSERVNELDDAQLADLAGRALPENAEPTLTEAAKRYQSEIGRRQALTDAAAHFEQNPDAVIGVAKTLDDIASGKPMSKGAHGSTAFNLASLSDDMLRRYQLAGEVLSSQYADKVGNLSDKIDKARELLNEESQRRAEGQTRDPEAIREADLAERAAAAIAKGKKPNIKGLSFETLDRMASGLEARAALEPRLADSARMLREAAQQGRMRAFNPQGQQQPGIQSAMRGWNAGQTEDPAQPIDFTQDRARLSELAQQADVTSRQRAILDQEAQRRAIREQQRVARSQEIAALNQQNPPLATPQGLPTVTPSAIPQSLGQLGQTRLGNGVDQLPIPAQPQPSTPNVTESQGQGRPGQAPPMGLPARPTGASQSQARGTPEQAASALLQQVPGRLGEQARLNQERVRRQGEWQAFGPDTGTLGIPRADMPQVKAEHRGALVNFLNSRGVAHEQDEEVDPTTLKPTQAEFSTKKVQQANEYQGGNRSILVSSDGHVVDGHHQWLSALSKGDPIKAIRLDAPIADLLPLVKEFPSSTESKASTASGGQTGGELVPEAAAQPQPEQRREERQAEAAPLLSQEAEKTRFAEPSNDDEANLEKLGYRLYKGVIRSKAKEAQLWASGWRPYLFDTEGKPAIHDLGIWAKPPKAAAPQKQKAPPPKEKGVAPTWNSASEIERAAMISRSSEKAGAPVSNAFAQRKADEWKTWADIPEGPAKKRLREYMKSVEQMSMPATMDGGKAAPEKTKNPYATSEERDEAISRLENAARNSEYRAIRENADLIGDAAKMGATEAEMMAAIEAGDGKALERIADRQHEKTGGLLLGFGNGKLSQPFGYKKVERHPAHDYKNWENLTDAQVNAFSKAASIKPGKTRQETLDRIDSRKTPAEWAEAWDKAFPENRNRLMDIGKAENTPNRTESQGKESDKKADIKPSKKAAKQSPPPASKGASRNRAINATVDAGKDSLLTAIAKIGGLDRAEAQRQGIDLAEFKRMPVFGKPVFRKNGGKSFDAMAESLSEFGYPVLDEKGNYSPNVLLDAISRELAGNPVYTPQGIESAAQRDAEEQAKFEQDNWLLDAVDLKNSGFDALNDQEQITAQLQAEASRDLGEDAADTIFERISQQHEQATPEQFNEALRAAFNEARQRQSANSREQAGEPGSVQAAGAILQDYSIEELRAEEERVAKAQADQAAKDNAAQQKTEADRARSDFVLTGSNRPADVAMARGQTNLLGAMEGRPKTRFSRAALSPIAKEAISYFGTTSNLEEAGYVLPDGTLLDFTGRSEASKNDYRRDGNRWIWAGKGRDYLSNQRSMDHREVSKLPSINKSSTDAMLEFQRDAKALRIDMMSGRVSANFSDWSPGQMRAAMAIARNNDGSLTIDFDHPVTNRLIRSIDLDRASQAKINALLLEETNKDRRFSRNEISSSLAHSISQARAQLVAALNERAVAALERSGKLILHRTDPTRTGAAGYVDPKGAIHLIPSNMDQDALSVALHEAMHLARDDRFSEGNRAHIRLAHAALKITGLKNFIGNPGFSNLVQQLHRLAAEGNKTAIEALDKARREAPGNVEDEALAYLVQYADEKLPIVRRIIAAIRAALYRMGIKVKLNPADVRALALSALKSRAKDAALVQTARTQESFSLPEFAPTESDKAEVERQMKAVKEVRDGQGRLLAPNGKPSNLNERQWKQVRTKFFNDWFGDWENDPSNASKVVDGNGEPLVVYHGSPDARFISEDATFKSQKERYGFGGELGVHWFASSENTAKTYADVRRAFDYQSADPGVISAFINIRDPIKIDAGGKKWRDAQKIGKTSDVIDQAQREERDGVIIDNVKDNYQTGVVKGDRPTTTFSVFRSAQIKSAIGNAGTFSARSNRIDYSQPTTDTDAAEQDRLWQEFQAVRAQFQERQASQSAFERWFGQGVEGVNVHKGKPLTLFHGTNNPEFNQWDESRSGQSSQHPTAGLGFFMTADKRSAARYGSRLLELHAKIDNPYFMTDADLVSIEDTQDAARFRRKLQAQGYDAAVISAPGGAPYVVALRSNQVKLASNDNPTESEDFRYSRPGGRQSPPAANPLPAETMGQAALRAVQDRFIRFRVIQDWLKQHGVNLTPDADVYGAESLLPKVTAARTQDAREKILKPLIESAAEKKWSIQGGDLLAAIEDQHPFPTKFKPSIPEFLHAQHAIERNAQIAKIKGAPKDGSGLNDAQAHEILTRYRVMPNFSEFSAMAEKFRTITDQTRRILRTSGIISAEQEAAWTSAYKKYVPLKGGPDTASQQNGTGPGISVNPGMKRALGHRLRDENIVENIWRDHERAIYLSEKQKVTRALRNMLEQANNQNIGTVGQPEKKATLHQGYYHQVLIDGNPLGAYGSYNEAKVAISSDAHQSGRPLSKYAVVHKPADPAVVFMSRPMLADNEVALYENGQRIRLQLNDELLARAARNLGVDGASGLLKAAQSFNRWLSHAYTGYNPEFILANVARDMTTGMINLSGQYGGKFALKTLKGYGSAVRGLWKQIHGKADPWVDRYRAAGGSTGAAYLSDLERIGTDLKRIFQDYQGASETLRQGDRAGAARVAVSDKIRWLGGWIEKMNQVGENALRVATFRAMVEAGHSDAVAARAAGDVTVNFNRKGELTPTLGGLYLFFNPSIQGTKAMWDAMAKGAHRGQAMAMAGSLTLLALTLAELARGGDDADEEAWKRIPGYVKDRNLVIKMGDIQGTIPIPYGYGAFWSLGNILSDISHGEDKTKAGIRFASSLFEQFSAIGNPFAGDEADIKNAVSLLPTALKPMMEIAMNRNSLGRPIMPEMSPWNTAQPDSARRWRSTTGSLYDGIASGLNRWTGGNAYQAGAIDISPETLSYLWRTFTGGAGKFAIDSMGLGTRIAQGVSPELREIPVLRKFVRAESIQDARTLFNEQSATVRLAVDAFNAAKRAKDLPAMRQMLNEQRQVLALGKVLQTAQKMIRARRELEDRINQSDLPLEEKRAQLKAVENQESAILSRFTARFEKARQESR